MTASAASRWILGALAVVAACSSSEATEPPEVTHPTFDRVTSTAGFDVLTTTTTVALGSTSTASSPDVESPPSSPTTGRPAPDSLGLVVAPEHLEGYDRDRFHHWIDADHDGCNTRCEVLAEEARPDVGWVSLYDGFVTTDRTQIQIDHLVALAEAWRSGAWAWDDGRREAFANDLDEPDALIAVSGPSNQSKADKDPAEWRPQLRSSWCRWVSAWVRIKMKWELTVDSREEQAVLSLLHDC
jgi:hypothetical protein